MNRLFQIILILAVSLPLFACGGKKGEGKMPEMEQMKYDNTVKRIEALAADAADAIASGNEAALESVMNDVRHLYYDFNAEKMDDAAKAKCQALKARVDDLREHPEKIADAANVAAVPKEDAAQGNSLISKRRMKLKQSERYAYALNAGDVLTVTIECQGGVDATVNDMDRKQSMRRWKFDGSMTDTVTIAADGVYMMELTPVGDETTMSLNVTCNGKTKGGRRRVKEQIVECQKDDFLAREAETFTAKSVFREPKKVGLRGNLKAYFSGKSRVVVPVTLPTGCDAVLYSLRISTNENTIGSDGKFAANLNVASSKLKLFGKTVYERQSMMGSIINSLLGDTRPPREEDAYCNMYVMTSQSEAKKFNDSEASDKKTYKYDVDQSQMGTQSCNGQLLPGKSRTLYLGFENERMRYDNYIWLEMAALTHTRKYVQPIYTK